MDLEGERKALVGLSAALASGDGKTVREGLQACRRGADPVRTEEVILQSYLFLGYPTALNAFSQWRELSGRAAPEPAEEDWEGWSRRGAEVCRTVYGGQYERLRQNIRDLHPDMERWMVVEGYGKVLGRPGLELPVRELCIVALLAVQGAPRQLYSHLRGALNAGAEPEEVEEALEVAARVPGPGDRMEAREVWEEVRMRWLSAGGNGASKAGEPIGAAPKTAAVSEEEEG